MKKNVFISFVSNYGYYELQPFIESWKKQKEELYLFFLDLSPWTKNCLEFNGVHLINVDEDLRNGFKDIGLLRMACVLRFLSKKMDAIEQVAIVDVRDVVLQNDSFFEKEGVEYLGLNCEAANNNLPIQAEWNTRFFHNEDWRLVYGDSPLINGGVFWGSVSEICKFFHMVLNYSKDRDTYVGIDQAIMNYIVYEKIAKNNIIFSHAKDGNVASINQNLYDYTIDGEYIINKNGKAPSIVHQYDRNKLLTKFVNEKYRRERACISYEYNDFRSRLELVKFLVLNKEYGQALDVLRKFGGRAENRQDICFSIAESMLREMESKSFELSSIRNYILAIMIDIFSNMSIDDKILFTERITRMIKHYSYVDMSVAKKISKEFISLVKYFSKEEDWSLAEKYITEINSLCYEQNEDFYVLASQVYLNVFKISEAKFYYNMYCSAWMRKKLISLDYCGYIDMLYNLKSDVIIFIATKDTHTAPWINRNMVLEKFGIKTDLNNTYRFSWLCVIDEGEVVKEISSKNERVVFEYQWDGNIGEVESAGLNVNNRFVEPVSIKINGKEVCINQRGLNFVVLDKKTGYLLDSVAFDIFDNALPYRMNLGNINHNFLARTLSR